MKLLTIYKTSSINEIPKLKKYFDEIERKSNIHIEVEREEVSAVVGELAGTALSILTSKYLSAALNMITLYEISKSAWKTIKSLKKSEIAFDIYEEFSKAIALNRALKLYKKWYKKEYKVLEPASIEISEAERINPETKTFVNYCYKDGFDDEGRFFGYNVSVVFYKKKKPHIKYSFLIRLDGKIVAVWSNES